MNRPVIRILTVDSSFRDATPKLVAEASAVILAPEKSLAEPGRIVLLAAAGEASAKHDLRALAQMAMFDFEEGTLRPEPVDARRRMIARSGGEEYAVDRGLVIARDLTGAARAWIHAGLDAKRLFPETYRYTTRWVRLDVR
jgi:hypothetical protein